MKIQAYSIQVIADGAEKRVSTHYRVLDDKDAELTRGTRDTPLSEETRAAVFAETQAALDADMAALTPDIPADHEAITVAMLSLGEMLTKEAQAKARRTAADELVAVTEQLAAVRQAELAALDAEVEEKTTQGNLALAQKLADAQALDARRAEARGAAEEAEAAGAAKAAELAELDARIAAKRAELAETEEKA